MNDLQEIKKKIYEEGRIPDVLEALGCEYIKSESRGERYVAQLPSRFDSHNKRSVQIKNNEHLNSYVRSRNISGDIYALVGYIEFGYATFDEIREHIGEIKRWICESLGYLQFLGFNASNVFVTKDWNAWLRPIQQSRWQEIDYDDNPVLDERILDQFIAVPHVNWLRSGINRTTQELFGVQVDINSERIVFPVHNKHGQLIGVKGRYFGSDPIIEEEYKYLLLYPYSKSIELFNLHRALPFIRQKHEVIVVESAKSCMLLTQWGYKNCVSIEGKDISWVQTKKLKDLKVTITFAWDKDVSKDDIRRYTKDYRTRLVYVVYDDNNLLQERDSPTDKGKAVWEQLYERRYKIY